MHGTVRIFILRKSATRFQNLLQDSFAGSVCADTVAARPRVVTPDTTRAARFLPDVPGNHLKLHARAAKSLVASIALSAKDGQS
jgi:hypothetical protein